MDENMIKFMEKLKELVPYAKKKKGVLEVQEINDFFGEYMNTLRKIMSIF